MWTHRGGDFANRQTNAGELLRQPKHEARRGGAVLHHATIACELDTDLMTRVLRIGREKLSE